MKKILKTLLIILIIIGFLFGITTIVKYIKLNRIYKKANELNSYNSFYLKTSFKKNDEDESIIEAFYREGKSKMLASNGIYTWTDGEKAYLIDEENSTIYTLDIEDNFALTSYNMFSSPIQGYNKNFVDRLLLAGDVSTTIKKEKIEGKNFYCIKTKENEATKKVWIEKDNSKIKKAEIEFSNGDHFYYDYELTFDSVRSSELNLPDITGYTLINGETGRILTENFNSINNE